MNRLTHPSIRVLTRPEHIQAVFKDSDRHLKAVNNNSGYLLSEILGRCVGLISQDEWKRVRAVTEAPFTRNTTTTSYLPLMQRRTHRHLAELQQGSANLTKGLIHPAKDLKMLPFWIVAEIIHGELDGPVETQLRELAPLRENLFNQHVIRGGVGRFHWSKYLPTEGNRQLTIFQKAWRQFNQEAYARARTLPSDRKLPILTMYDAVRAGTITLDELLHTLDEMLYANLDVTLGGLSWNLVFLAAHPASQQKLYDEVTSHSATLTAYLNSSESFLQACVTESSRLRPLAAFSVPQATPTPRVVGGYHLPAGTHYIVDSYALNQRNPYWGADAELYKPERHFRKDFSLRFNMWRFGFGPRQCLGKYVADLSMRVLLAELITGWELTMRENGSEWERLGGMWINHPDLMVGCVERKGGR